MEFTDGMRGEKQALFLLNNMKGMQSDRLLRLYEFFESFVTAYEMGPDAWIRAGIFKQEKVRDAFAALKENASGLLMKYARLEESGVKTVSILDEDYPARLMHIADRPPLLYYCGRLPDDSRPSAAIIGARNCSEYGRSVAEFFAGELARRGIQVVSGLAHGIDKAAARGSLDASSESYGVLGCGINICYPRESWQFYHRMKLGEGGIVSEFPPDDDAFGYHFVLRNRLISGFADVVLVIEAAEKSGTSTTVGYALDQGKEVFALPGRITDPLGFGCNRLLKEGANVLTSPSDVLEYFGLGGDKPLKMGEQDLGALNKKEKKVYRALMYRSQHVETLASRCGLDIAETMSVLAGLEARGYAVSPRGAYYRKAT